MATKDEKQFLGVLGVKRIMKKNFNKDLMPRFANT